MPFTGNDELSTAILHRAGEEFVRRDPLHCRYSSQVCKNIRRVGLHPAWRSVGGALYRNVDLANVTDFDADNDNIHMHSSLLLVMRLKMRRRQTILLWQRRLRTHQNTLHVSPCGVYCRDARVQMETAASTVTTASRLGCTRASKHLCARLVRLHRRACCSQQPARLT